ncbi:MAG: SigB/SigF/SigG family RNA polymerase sigma factor [Anaerovoracaceae bacterium]
MKNQEMFEKYRESGDIEQRNLIVEEYLYLVDILIRKYLGKGFEYDDLYQVGALALISAVERFDPSKGFEFNSFATPTILGEIKKHFRDKGWSVKVPRRLKELSVAIPKAKEQLIGQLGRVPKVSEIADFLNEKEETILRAMESGAAYGALSLNQTFEENGDEGIASMFEKYTAEEEKGYVGIENREIIQNVLKELTGTNRYIFKKRFVEDQSQSEIAKKLGVSQMTISRAEKKILEKFAKELAN